LHLVQILLPLYHNDGSKVAAAVFRKISQELTDRFGGLTAYNRSPAEGRWTKDKRTRRDVIIVVEVMTEKLDAKWWRRYRRDLEARLDQEAVILRSQRVRIL
jgi:hypothetical protein